MYYTIRLVIYSLILIIFFLLNKKYKFIIKVSAKKQPELYKAIHSDKKIMRKSRLTILGVAVGLALIGIVLYYPFEGYFINFSTVEQSMSYKGIDCEGMDIHNYDDCVFVVDNRKGKIYTLTHSENGYGLVDFKCDGATFRAVKWTNTYPVSYQRIIAKHNNETNKSIYIINMIEEELKNGDSIRLNGNKVDFYKEFTVNPSSKYAYKIKEYVYTDNRELPRSFDLFVDDINTEFQSSNYIHINIFK